MNYSYIMGIKNVDELKNKNFKIEPIDEDYGITFDDSQRSEYESFIFRNLENGYWNEYLGKEIVFIFKFNDSEIKRYVLNKNNEKEILKLCCDFAECNFNSIEEMLKENEFYLKNYFDNK